jgi:prevent-host-death family protein
LNELKDDLSRYLRMAEKQDVIITRHGVPAGILIGFEDPEDWWEESLLRDPRFRERIAQARAHLREGRGARIEELREKYESEPPAEGCTRCRRGALRWPTPAAAPQPRPAAASRAGHR